MYSHYTSVVTMEQHLKMATGYIDMLSTTVDDMKQEMTNMKDKLHKVLTTLNVGTPS